MTVEPITKHCISCREDGHTYLECPRVSFGALMCGAFGIPVLFGQTPEEAAAELAKIARAKASKGG